jgi:hypothetical protein
MVLTDTRRYVAALSAIALAAAVATGCGTSHRSAAPPAGSASASPGSTAGLRGTNGGVTTSTGPGLGAVPTAGQPSVNYDTIATSLTSKGVHLVNATPIAVTPAIKVGPFVSSYAMDTAQLSTGTVWFGAWHDHSGMAAMVNLVKAGATKPQVDGLWTDGDWMVMLQASTAPLTATFANALKAIGATQVYP